MVKYLEENFGLHCQILRLNRQQEEHLPLYLKGNFEVYSGTLAGHDLIWVKMPEREDITPDQLQKYGEQFKQILSAPVVFIFDKLESWKRKRLIEKHVGFVQPFKQLYIPDLFLQLNDVIRNEYSVPAVQKLTPPAQCAILYHLQVFSLENISFQQIAARLNYSTMTISRIVKELSAFNLLSVEGSREKYIKFNMQGKELWEKALPLFSSPVRGIWFTSHMEDDAFFRIAGDTALAVYTMLAGTNERTYAIGKDNFRVMKAAASFERINKQNDANRIEIWEYDPALLSPGKEVDKLSLYLSMQYEEDERVIRSLQDLIDEIKW